METNKTLVCPNCGANITNYRNCEYCGSLLVRFTDKGIDIQKTVYFDNSKVFNRLFNALKLSLKMRKQSSDTVALDVYKNPHIPICAVVQADSCVFVDDTIVPRDSDDGMFVIFNFDHLMEEELNKFRKLDCFPLFIERSCIISTLGVNQKITECFIDFGRDAEGAARLLSDIIEKLYGVVADSELEFEVNVGDNIDKSRNYHANRRPIFNNKKDIKKNKFGMAAWVINAPLCLVLGIESLESDDILIGVFFLFIAFVSILILFVYRHSILYLFRGLDDNKK